MKLWNKKLKQRFDEKQEYKEVNTLKRSKLTRREFILTVLTVLTITSFAVGSSYALFSDTETSANYSTVESGNLAINFEESTDGIGNILNLNGAFPVSDSEGISTPGYTFKVTNNGTLTVAYKIKIVDDQGMITANDATGQLLDHSMIKVSIDGSDPVLLSTLSSNEYIIKTALTASGNSNTHNIKMWIDYNAGNEALNKYYHGKIIVEAIQDDIEYLGNSNSTAPVIVGNNPFTITQNSAFTDPGVENNTGLETTYKSCNENGVCNNITSIDTSIPGMYLIYYSNTDSDGNKGSSVRSVNVYATGQTGPTITLTGDNPYIQQIDTVYTDPGYTGGTSIIKVGDPNIAVAGNFLIKYISKDNSNNYTISTRIVEVEGKQSTACDELPSYGTSPNAPELVGDMIPVVYDETQDEWLKADTNSIWYNYDEQMWANAVTVTETNRATLVSSNPGTVIPMDDINAMFVWIPRYSYTIGNTYGVQGCGGNTPTQATPGAIDIKWINSSTTDTGEAAYTVDTVAEWYTNSAFCWGDTCDDINTRNNPGNRELTGLWVGKFETSTTGGVETNATQQPIIKPTVTSWRSVNVSNIFYSVQQYMNSTSGENIFGLSGSTYDTHMMKNTEWGAVAYLSQSKYGKYGNTNYVGAEKEVAINNCSIYITGIGGDSVSAPSSSSTCSTNTYETELGQAASTTGNIYGIYDMSGGAYEHVMGNMENSSSAFNTSYSGFTTPPDKKYYNSYTYNTNVTTGRMLGDSTKETAGFYGDLQSFLTSDNSWFHRGGYYINNSGAGIFSFYATEGGSSNGRGFRVSLTS